MTDAGSLRAKVPEHHEHGVGLVLRLEDGSAYFLRKEVLDLCRVTDEDSMRLVEGALSGSDEVSGFGFDVERPSAQVVRVEGKLQPSSFWKAMSEAVRERPESEQEADEDAEVAGFRKAGGTQMEYLVVNPTGPAPISSTAMCPW